MYKSSLTIALPRNLLNSSAYRYSTIRYYSNITLGPVLYYTIVHYPRLFVCVLKNSSTITDTVNSSTRDCLYVRWLDRVGLGWIGLDWVRLGWIG